MARRLTAADSVETYKALVYEYEQAKAEGRWEDSQDAALLAQEAGSLLPSDVATEARDDVLYGGWRPRPAVERGRYSIVKDVVEYDCEHPLCGQLHKNSPIVYETIEDAVRAGRKRMIVQEDYRENPNAYHPVIYTQWLIIDNQTGDRAFTGEVYRTRRDAKAELESYLRRA